MPAKPAGCPCGRDHGDSGVRKGQENSSWQLSDAGAIVSHPRLVYDQLPAEGDKGDQMRHFKRVTIVAFVACAAWAQLANQTALVGTVVDSSGSVVPGAEVAAVNVATQDRYHALTNAEGYYNIQF